MAERGKSFREHQRGVQNAGGIYCGVWMLINLAAFSVTTRWVAWRCAIFETLQYPFIRVPHFYTCEDITAQLRDAKAKQLRTNAWQEFIPFLDYDIEIR